MIVIWGAGKIGRGFIADLFYRAGYSLYLIESSKELVNELKEQGSYTVLNYRSETDREKIKIKDFSVYHTSEKNKIINLMRKTSIGAIAVHPVSFLDISLFLSQIFKERATRRVDEPLDIIICANIINPASVIKEQILSSLTIDEKAYFKQKVGLINSIVLRMAPEPTPEMKEKDHLVVLTNGYPFLMVDKTAFKGKLPEVEGLKPVNNIHAQEIRKIYTYNMIHAVLAYLGKQKGYQYVVECLNDPSIRITAEKALKEISMALEAEYGFNRLDMIEWNENLMKNMANPILKDRVDRVGADPVRKLKRQDRLVGPALLCLKHGIKPEKIARAISAVFLFYNENDPTAKEIQKYLEGNTLEEAVKKFCQLNPHREPDRSLIEMIISHSR